MLVTKIAKWSVGSFFGSTAVAVGVVGLDANEIIDLTNYSVIRAARTGLTTVKTIVDYKWSLRNLEYGTDQYQLAKSEV